MRFPLTVAQAAELAGVTVRTLHHYDSIGLVVPADRSEAGYRLYGPEDLSRLREILTWRRLGVALADIPGLLEPGADRAAVLRRQRALVEEQIGKLGELAAALDRAIADTTGDTMQTDQEIIDALGGFDPADHAEEAERRWGDTEAFRQSRQRTARYGPAEWAEVRAEAEAVTERLAAVWAEGAAADAEAAMDAAEAHRLHVCSRFYECEPEMHRGLGELYVTDPRFTAAWEGEDGARAGFAGWLRETFAANAARRAV